MWRRFPLVLLLLFAAACSTTTTKESGAGKTEAAAPGSAAPAAKSSATPGNQPLAVSNPLKDASNILSKRSVYFDFDESLIKDNDRPLLEAHARYLREHPDAKVTVQGNTDERGSREYNLALGQRRADAVKRFMALLSAADRQVDTVSFGKEKPRCTFSQESCWSQNRRADLVYRGD